MKTDLLDIRHADCVDVMRGLPAKSQHIVIADPPYFKVKGGFDFAWDSFDDYLKQVDIWASETKRVLADNGTLLWWGNDRKIAYSQIILDKYFSLENSMIWEKLDSMQYQYYSVESARRFNTHNERLLVYSNETDGKNTADRNYALELGRKHTQIMEPIVSYMIGEMESAGLDCAKINTAMDSSMASHWFARTSQWALPTKESYLKLQLLFNGEFLRREYEELRREYEELRREYEELRREYEELRRPFNNELKLTDVLKFSQESSETSKHDHPTQKPPKLCRALIRTCSKPRMNAFIPFMGSGVECVEAFMYGLSVTASELDADYYKAACARIKEQTRQTVMF